MSIVDVSPIYTRWFKGQDEPVFDMTFGTLGVAFSRIRAKRNLDAGDKYALSLLQTEEQHLETKGPMLDRLVELAKAKGYKTTRTKLELALERSVGKSTTIDGAYRFYGSRKMAYKSQDTGKLEPFKLNVYDKTVSEETFLERPPLLGHGSKVRSRFQVGLFETDSGQLCVSISPTDVVIMEVVELPPREDGEGESSYTAPNFDAVEDSNAYFD